jgi:hypothetical protein
LLARRPSGDIRSMKRFLQLMGYVLLPVSIAASSCGGDGFMSKGEYCSKLAGPTCDRAIACGDVTSSERSECLTEFQDDCCQSDGSCGELPSDQQEEMELQTVITDCSAALATFDCTALEEGDAPVACGGTSTAYLAGSLPSLKTGVVAASAHQMSAARKRLRSPR